MQMEVSEAMSSSDRRDRLMLRLEIDDFNTRYAEVLDRGDLMDWPKFFSEQPFYKIASRENHSGNFPIGIMYCDSKAMLEDRVTAIKSSMEFSPRFVTHYVTGTQILDVKDDRFSARANFLLVENVADQKPYILMSGQYYDRFARTGGGLLLEERICVYDSVLIQTSIIYPV